MRCYILFLIGRGFLQAFALNGGRAVFCNSLADACVFATEEEALQTSVRLSQEGVKGEWYVYYRLFVGRN